VRTVYFGTSEFAAAVLQALAATEDKPTLVVTRPDARQGRGRRLRPPPAAEAAAELGIECYQPEDVNSAKSLARIAEEAPAAVCLCAFGALIREPLLSSYNILNVHPSLLPRWRGAAPIEHAILAGDSETGVSIMKLGAGLDSGPVCLQEAEPITDDDTYGSLSARLEKLGGNLLIRALELYMYGELEFVEQDEEHVTYAEKITPEDRLLNPLDPAALLARRVRALTPQVGCYVQLLSGQRLGVLAARVIEDAEVREGELVLMPPAPVLGCSLGALELTVVQPAGKRAMAGADYVRGLH
jgi:methionyl-tRNA formyltransferase